MRACAHVRVLARAYVFLDCISQLPCPSIFAHFVPVSDCPPSFLLSDSLSDTLAPQNPGKSAQDKANRALCRPLAHIPLSPGLLLPYPLFVSSRTDSSDSCRAHSPEPLAERSHIYPCVCFTNLILTDVATTVQCSSGIQGGTLVASSEQRDNGMPQSDYLYSL